MVYVHSMSISLPQFTTVGLVRVYLADLLGDASQRQQPTHVIDTGVLLQEHIGRQHTGSKKTKERIGRQHTGSKKTKECIERQHT